MQVSVVESVEMGALRIAAEASPTLSPEELEPIMPKVIPPRIYELHTPQHWARLMQEALFRCVPNTWLCYCLLLCSHIAPYVRCLRSCCVVLYRLKDVHKKDAKIKFMDVAHTWPLFGTAMFSVMQHQHRDWPEQMTLGVNRMGIHMMNQSNKHPLLSVAFADILSWRKDLVSSCLEIRYLIGKETQGTVQVLTDNVEGVFDYIEMFVRILASEKNQKAKTAVRGAGSCPPSNPLC
jgi:hypothetical protein